MSAIKIAIVGVGNCASALVQGLHHYSQPGMKPDGVMEPVLGGYYPHDIEVVAAFDVDDRKIGLDVVQAIWSPPNCTYQFSDGMPLTGAVVRRGPTLDGIGPSLRSVVSESSLEPVNVAEELRKSGAQIVVGYLPVGSEQAVRHYAQAALDAGCAYINCVPVFLASDPDWAKKFEEAKLPIIGDDIKSQVGATIVHRVLANLMEARGVRLKRTSQLNVGGNTDFLGMLDQDRLASKRKSKTQAVTSAIGRELPERDVHVGPSDHVQWLDDRKWCYIRLEAEGFGGAPTNIELKLEVHDSPNSAGVVMDAIRSAKLALDRGESGALPVPSAYYMKSPPVQMNDHEARSMLKKNGQLPW